MRRNKFAKTEKICYVGSMKKLVAKLISFFTKDRLVRIVLFLLALNLTVWLFRPVIVQHRKDLRFKSSVGLVERLLNE